MEQWADSNSLSLIHNVKLPKSFNSAIWKNGYNSDLIFVSLNISDICEKSVLDPIPRTQHRPICVTVNPIIVSQPTTSRRRFNPKKGNWDGFATEFDAAIEEVNSIPENYGRFIELLCVVSRRHIPRGCRSNYIPVLTEESKNLYEAYKRQYSSNHFGEGTLETGAKLIDTMKEQKRKNWKKVITSTDLNHNSRKAWQTIRKLSNDATSTNPPCLVNTSSARQWPRNNANKAKVPCTTNCRRDPFGGVSIQ